MPATNRPAKHEHDVGVAMVSATIAILAGGASELRHRHYHGVFAKRTEVGPEGGDGLREITKHVGELAFHGSFIDVMVPPTNVGESDLHAEVRLDELSGLPQRIPEAALRIVRAGS